jgi:hypothetical protein
MMYYAIYIIVNGGPAWIAEYQTAGEVAAELKKLESKNPNDHYVVHRLEFASRIWPPEADEIDAVELPDD